MPRDLKLTSTLLGQISDLMTDTKSPGAEASSGDFFLFCIYLPYILFLGVTILKKGETSLS